MLCRSQVPVNIFRDQKDPLRDHVALALQFQQERGQQKMHEEVGLDPPCEGQCSYQYCSYSFIQQKILLSYIHVLTFSVDISKKK